MSNLMRTYLYMIFTIFCLTTRPFTSLGNQRYYESLDVTTFCSDSSETMIIVGLRYGGYWQTFDAGISWTPIGDKVTNDAHLRPHQLLSLETLDAKGDTIISKSKITPVTLWQYSISIDRGKIWKILQPPGSRANYSNFLIVDPENRSKLYFISPTIFAKSNNFGESWTTHIYDTRHNQKKGFFKDPDSLSTFYICGYPINAQKPTGLWKSSHNGWAWKPIFDPELITKSKLMLPYDAVLLSNKDYIVLPTHLMNDQEEISYPNYLLMGCENGARWSKKDVGLPEGFEACKIVEIPWSPGTLLIYGLDRLTTSGLYLSRDYGNHFEPAKGGLPDDLRIINNITLNRFNKTVYISTSGYGVWKSEDSGINWEPLLLSLNFRRHQIFNITEKYIFTRGVTDNQISSYDFMTNRWTDIEMPSSEAREARVINYPIVIEESENLIAFQERINKRDNRSLIQVVKQNKKSKIWENIGTPLHAVYNSNEYPSYINFPSVISDNKKSILINSRHNSEEMFGCFLLDVSADSGKSFNSTGQWTLKPNVAGDSRVLFAADPFSSVLASYDYGVTWQDCNFPDSEELSTGTIPLYDISDSTLYLMANSSIYSLKNTKWKRISNKPLASYAAIVLANGKSRSTILITSTITSADFISIVEYSVDKGKNWRRIDLISPYKETHTVHEGGIRYDPWRNRIYLSTFVGLMYVEVDDLLPESGKTPLFKPLNISSQ